MSETMRMGTALRVFHFLSDMCFAPGHCNEFEYLLCFLKKNDAKTVGVFEFDFLGTVHGLGHCDFILLRNVVQRQ